MKQRILIWASVGFLIACCWVLFTFLASADYLHMIMRQPVVQAVAVISCPITFVRQMPLPFWCLPPINAATYAAIGFIIEMLRRKLKPGLAV